MNYNEAMEKLKKYGQEHVLKYYAELPDEQRNTLIEQIDRTDFTVIGQAAETEKRKRQIRQWRTEWRKENESCMGIYKCLQ